MLPTLILCTQFLKTKVKIKIFCTDENLTYAFVDVEELKSKGIFISSAKSYNELNSNEREYLIKI